jgi:hypothetical protein
MIYTLGQLHPQLAVQRGDGGVAVLVARQLRQRILGRLVPHIQRTG